MIRTAILALALAGPASAADWTADDTRWQGAVVALSVADWLQTRQIAKQPERYFERNPILGRHPSVGRVDAYFATSIALHTAITYALPQPWRRGWQYVSIAWEGGMVANNYRLGIDVKF